MEDIIKSFHIDWKLMIAQLINFGIVVFVVWRFGLQPLIGTMDKRNKEIEKGLADAKRIEEEIKQLAVTKEEIIKEAKKQAENVRQEAEAAAEAQRQETLTRVRIEAAKVLEEEKQKFAVEKERLLHEVRRQAASLIVQATAKVLGKTVTPTLDRKVVEESIQEVVNKQYHNHKK